MIRARKIRIYFGVEKKNLHELFLKHHPSLFDGLRQRTYSKSTGLRFFHVFESEEGEKLF